MFLHTLDGEDADSESDTFIAITQSGPLHGRHIVIMYTCKNVSYKHGWKSSWLCVTHVLSSLTFVFVHI